MLGVGLLEESKGQAFNCQDADETRGLKVTDVWTPREDVCSSPTSSSISMVFMEIPILRGLGQAGVGSWAIFPAPLPPSRSRAPAASALSSCPSWQKACLRLKPKSHSAHCQCGKAGLEGSANRLKHESRRTTLTQKPQASWDSWSHS